MKQLFLTALLLFAVFAGTRALIRVLPGDPAETLVAESGTSIPVETIRHDLGLDQPFASSVFSDAARALHGDFGISIFNRQPVGPMLWRRFGRTAHLGLTAFAIGLAVSLVLGLLSAGYLAAGDQWETGYARVGRAANTLCTLYGAVAAALPTPWTGPMLIIVFALWLPIFSIGGSVALPALTLAASFSGFWARLLRERVRETLTQDAARAARARGVSELGILLKYGLMPASGSLAAFLGTQLGFLLAGAFVIEVIFDWRGLGSYLLEGVSRRDYPVVEGATFVAAAVTLLGNLLGDIGLYLLNPRIRTP